MNGNLLRATLVSLLGLGMLAMLSGCGVKSAPKTVEGSEYPRVYPAPEARPDAPKTERNNTGRVIYRRPQATDSAGTYTPPPPATELLAQ